MRHTFLSRKCLIISLVLVLSHFAPAQNKELTADESIPIPKVEFDAQGELKITASPNSSPLRIFVFTSEESNSVQSRQLASRLSRCRLCIFHFPTRKSKSLGEEFGEAVILSSPCASNSTLGIGILSSAVSSLFCAGAKWERTKTRLMIRHFLERKVCRIAQPRG